MSDIRVPVTPEHYADFADQLASDHDLPIADAYWQAACVLLGITETTGGPILVGLKNEGDSWRVRWIQDRKTYSRRFASSLEADEFAYSLCLVQVGQR